MNIRKGDTRYFEEYDSDLWSESCNIEWYGERKWHRRGGEGWSIPLGMRPAIGRRMNMDISGRSKAHCFHYVVNMQGSHGTLSCNLSTGEQQKEAALYVPWDLR